MCHPGSPYCLSREIQNNEINTETWKSIMHSVERSKSGLNDAEVEVAIHNFIAVSF